MIDVRLLNYFLAIAREQSITKAANSLHISQSTLSKQMIELENQLGQKLLVRGRKQTTLTDAGTFLRSRAQEMLDLMDKTESAFSGGSKLIGGDIFLGCGETPSMEFITSIFQNIHTDYPEIHFNIFSGDADVVMEQLDKGLLDIGLVLGPMHYEKYNYINLNKTDIYGLLMPKDCELAKKDNISIADLQALPLIFPSQTYKGHQQLEWFGLDIDSFHIIGTYSLIYNATFMVEQGLGYAFCLGNLIETEGKRNLTFRPLSPTLSVDLSIVTKKYQTYSPAVGIFLQYLKNKLNQENHNYFL